MSESTDATTYSCPQCGTAIAEPADLATNLLECPNCGNQFFIKRKVPPRPAGGASFASHVHDLARGRRALIRYRSYFVIGGLGCFVLLGQIIFLLARYKWTTTGRNVLGMLAVAFAIGLVFCARRAMAVSNLLRKPLQQEPAKPPDFDSL
jgi:DNA-directed RNA polymerase subunit RPC12/RpoP